MNLKKLIQLLFIIVFTNMKKTDTDKLQCKICYEADSQTSTILYEIKEKIREFEKNNTPNNLHFKKPEEFRNGFFRLIKLIFKGKFKHQPPTLNCRHTKVRCQIQNRLKLSTDTLNMLCMNVATMIGNHHFHTEILSMQVKGFKRYLKPKQTKENKAQNHQEQDSQANNQDVSENAVFIPECESSDELQPMHDFQPKKINRHSKPKLMTSKAKGKKVNSEKTNALKKEYPHRRAEVNLRKDMQHHYRKPPENLSNYQTIPYVVAQQLFPLARFFMPHQQPPNY